MYKFDVVVVGGGPAGMGAAVEASRKGASVAILERNDELGGILNQCIHSGFGLQYFKEELTGPEYAENFKNQVEKARIKVFLNTMVTEIKAHKEVVAVSTQGIITLQAGAIVLSMGCRERTRGAIKIPGSRPAGVLTAGLAQRYVNMENLKPGNRIVILGSGDIGLIMARRLALEGMEVVGVYELMPYANGLFRNVKNCLDDFCIPLHLSTTVTRVIGYPRVEAVEVCQVDACGCPIPGKEKIVPCDTLLLSVGLIPENELSQKLGVVLDQRTNGPLVNQDLETSVSGVFACGNVLHVHDLVDKVTVEAIQAGGKAAAYALSDRQPSEGEKSAIEHGENIAYTVPSYFDQVAAQDLQIKFRVKKPLDSGVIKVINGDKIISESKIKSFKPSIMEEFPVNLVEINGKQSIRIIIEEVEDEV
ncbi:FAD-dependent oxidoreductase [Eubacteriaceae bacterium ES3]|nr:FAD-dependent oxidoreductase [Eubacteriaceae bacterium ES3]